jgi:hypothetical protein
MKYGIIVAGIGVLFSLAVPVFALDVRTGEQVLITTNEFISENTYLAGGQVTVSGTLRQDAVVAGGRVVMNGEVAGDLMVAGGIVDVFEKVQGDVRIAGGQVTIAEPVAGDVVVVGGSVSILPGAVVGGDLLVAGGVVFLDGTVNGAARIVAGEFVLNGRIAEDVSVRVGEKFTLNEDARIGGTLTYRAPQIARFDASQVGGEVFFTANRPVSNDVVKTAAGIGFGIFMLQFVMMLFVALLFVWLMPRIAHATGTLAVTHSWTNAGLGFIALVVVPIASIILFGTIIGLFAGFVLILAYLFMLTIASAVAGVVMGGILSRFLKKETLISWKWTLVGVAILQILSLIPIIGWALAFLVYLITLGTLLRQTYTFISTERA